MATDNEFLRLIYLAQGIGFEAPAAAGVTDWIKVFTVPDGKQWQLLGARTRLTTDATAGDRRLSLAVGTVNQLLYQSRSLQAANLVWDYNFGIGQPAELVGTQVYVPISPLLLTGGTQIFLQVAGGQGADAVTLGGSRLYVLERV